MCFQNYFLSNRSLNDINILFDAEKKLVKLEESQKVSEKIEIDISSEVKKILCRFHKSTKK